MGSGGPRGLQILPSVADRGRGGFDSHTFPPLPRRRPLASSALVLLALLAATAQARAQAGAPADSVTAAPGARLATRTAGERPRPGLDQPTAVMLRSLVVPGWGQWKNGRPWKGLLALGLEGYAGVRLVDAWRDVDDALERESDALAAGDAAGAAQANADYNEAFTRRATAGWVLAAVVLVSMVDAYVDAHLLQFDADFGSDPGLSPDLDPPPASPRARLGLRVGFTGP